MRFHDYQEEAKRTLNFKPDWHPEYPRKLAVLGLGLAGEAGEVVEHIKKFVGHGHELNREHVKKELGDVLWYLAAVASQCGLRLDDVAAANIAKLRARYPNGFSHDDSRNRKDGEA